MEFWACLPTLAYNNFSLILIKYYLLFALWNGKSEEFTEISDTELMNRNWLLGGSRKPLPWSLGELFWKVTVIIIPVMRQVVYSNVARESRSEGQPPFGMDEGAVRYRQFKRWKNCSKMCRLHMWTLHSSAVKRINEGRRTQHCFNQCCNRSFFFSLNFVFLFVDGLPVWIYSTFTGLRK